MVVETKDVAMEKKVRVNNHNIYLFNLQVYVRDDLLILYVQVVLVIVSLSIFELDLHALDVIILITR